MAEENFEMSLSSQLFCGLPSQVRLVLFPGNWNYHGYCSANYGPSRAQDPSLPYTEVVSGRQIMCLIPAMLQYWYTKEINPIRNSYN